MDYKILVNDSLLCADSVHSSSFGVVGEPVPELLSLDSTMNLILMGCLVFFIVALAHSYQFFIRQTSSFFYESHDDEIENYTMQEHLLQVAIIVMGCLLLAISTFIPAVQLLAPHQTFPNQVETILLFSLYILGYLFVKLFVQYVANVVFFGRRRSKHFLGIQVFITACTSILFLPIAFLLIYSEVDARFLLVCLVFVLIMNKILSFYKVWNTFSRQNGLFLQIILYFCTLEIAPLAAAGGIWLSIFNGLK